MKFSFKFIFYDFGSIYQEWTLILLFIIVAHEGLWSTDVVSWQSTKYS